MEKSEEQEKRGWSNRLSPYSGTLLFLGLILIGFCISLLYGGFPSILLPSFLILAIGIPVDIIRIFKKPIPKKESEPVTPLKAFFMLVLLFLVLSWFGALLGIIERPNVVDRVLRKVEYPFSEASHVTADSKGYIYVFSRFNARVQKYNRDGRFQFGWFSGGWKGIEMAIDENDYIYTYAGGSIVRKYDSNGNMIQIIKPSEPNNGWWRLKGDLVLWDQNAHEPQQYDEYHQAVKDGDLLPETELRKTGFKTAEAMYYKLKRLWFLFPVVSIEGYPSDLEGYVMPNPLSLAFTFVFPGFIFYILVLIILWVLDKPAERFTKRCLVYILGTVVIFIIGATLVVVGGTIVMTIANSLSKSNHMHFWLVPIVVIPYWIIVGGTSFYLWGFLCQWFHKATTEDEETQDNTTMRDT